MDVFVRTLLLLMWAVGGRAEESSQTIAPLNLLLPVATDTRVEFVVQAFNGCYRFTSSDPSVISLRPLPGNHSHPSCATQAVARVEVHQPARSVVWLTAEDVQSGVVLRCQARVAELARIDIVTRIRTLDVGVFETAEVVGFDAQGNAFNSLEGLKFSWSLSQSGDFADVSSFRESALEVTRVRQAIEDAGEQSDQLVLRTKRIGRVVLEARLRDRRAAPLLSSVTLLIAENIVFRPDNSVVLLRHSALQLAAYLVKGDKASRHVERIANMGRFGFKVVGPAVVEVSATGRITSFGQTGTTSLEITDLQNPDSLYKIRVEVADVDALSGTLFAATAEEARRVLHDHEHFTLFPKKQLEEFEVVDNWSVIVGRVYLLRLGAKTSLGNDLNLAGETIDWGRLTDGFEVLGQHNNLVVLRPKRPGSLEVSAVVRGNNSRGPISFSRQILSQTPLTALVPRNPNNEIFLPPPGQTLTPQQFQFEVAGGSGVFSCVSSNPSAVRIAHPSTLVVQGLGQSTIRCIDRENTRNTDEFKVSVQQLGRIELPSRLEGLPSSPVAIPFRFTDENGRFYANCSQVVPQWTAKSLHGSHDGPTFALDKKGWAEDWQGLAALLSHAPFTDSASKRGVRWSLQDDSGLIGLGDRAYEGLLQRHAGWAHVVGICGVARLSSPRPDLIQVSVEAAGAKTDQCLVKIHQALVLKVVPVYNETIFGKVPLIAFGRSLQIQIAGGPQPWNETSQTLLRVTTDDEHRFVQTSVRQTAEGHALEIHCKPQSDAKDDRHSDFVDISVHITAHNPADEYLSSPVLATIQTALRCARPTHARHLLLPDALVSDLTFVSHFRPVLHLRNNKRHLFGLWAFDGSGQPFWNFTSAKVTTELKDATIAAKFGAVGIPSDRSDLKPLETHGSHLLELNLPQDTGSLVTVAHLHLPSPSKADLVSAVTVKSTQQLDLEPNAIEILSHPRNEATLTILNGSGNFRVSTESEKVVRVFWATGDRRVRLTPVGPGRATVRVVDIGVEPQVEAVAEVEVLSLDSLKLLLSDKAIENKSETKLTILASAAVQEQLAKLPARALSSPSSGLEIERLSPSSFTLKGIENGEYLLHAEIDGHALPHRVMLRVHPQLTVFPDKLVLMPGCQAFFRLVGGPHDLFTPEYDIRHSSDSSLGTLTELSPGFYRFEATKGKGKGELTFRIHSGEKEVAVAKVALLVDFPTELVVSGPYKLLQRASAVVWASPRFHSEEFSPGFCRMGFDFHVTGDPDVLAVTPLTVSEAMSPSFLSLLVTAKRPGVARVDFQLTTDSAHKSLQISKSFSVRVVDNQDLSHQMFMDQQRNCSSVFGDGSYTIPPRSALSFPSRLHPFLVPLNNVTQIAHRNTLVSSDRIGKDSLTLTDTDTDIQAHKHVQVAIPAHLVLQGIQQVAYLQGKTTVALKAHFMDAVGRLFTPTSSPLSLEVINTDQHILDADYDPHSATLTVTSKQDGRAIIYVKSADFPRLVCPIMVMVGTVVQPQGPLVVQLGSEIRFESSFAGQSHTHANASASTWTSSNSEVVEINPRTGRAVAKAVGRTSVKWHGSVVPEVEVRVVAAESLRPKNHAFTISDIKDNRHYQSQYQFEYEPAFPSSAGTPTSNRLISDNLEFTCRSSHPSVAARGQRVDVPNEDGTPSGPRYMCLVQMQRGESIPPDVKITAELASKTASFRVSTSDSLRTVTAFVVETRDRSLDLSKDDPTRVFYVKTAVQLRVTSSDSLQGRVHSEFNAKNRVQQITVEFPPDFNEELSGTIELSNPETQQTEVVSVGYQRTASVFSLFDIFGLGSRTGSFQDYILILICLGVLYGVARSWFNRRDEQSELTALSNMNSRLSKNKFE